MSNLPPGVTQSMVDRAAGAGVMVTCTQCRVDVDPDDAVQAMGRDFCSNDQCIADWALENIDEVLERIKD